ncbi:hypothetical protein RJ640_029745 [Escallonia rubra]|uniref:TF-B3 domain-containing protein n=1 Tax=Escallonia rubra TaxID=112253 RepID=A0AA88R0Y9_9ASTE|nr:hypothetical protein RJ640_029745 [Escallonia rubra]
MASSKTQVRPSKEAIVSLDLLWPRPFFSPVGGSGSRPRSTTTFSSATPDAPTLQLPSSIITKHCADYKNKEKIVICDIDGNRWTVNFIRQGISGCFCGGFVHDNDIKEGDTCLFELVGQYEMLTHIPRKNKEVQQLEAEDSYREKGMAMTGLRVALRELNREDPSVTHNYIGRKFFACLGKSTHSRRKKIEWPSLVGLIELLE